MPFPSAHHSSECVGLYTVGINEKLEILMKINAFCEGLLQAVNTGCCIPVNEHIVPFKSISYQYTAPLQRAARKETLLIKLVRRDNREAGYVLTSLHGIKLLCFSSYFFPLESVFKFCKRGL
jgi:hypothetical protein